MKSLLMKIEKRILFLFVGLLIKAVRYMLEQIALDPILERPFLHAHFRGYHQTLGRGELNRQF